MHYFNICFPKVRITLKPRLGTWITDDIRKEKNNLVFLQKLSRSSSLSYADSIRNKKRFLRNKINQTKKQYFNSKIKNSSNVMKATWSIINSETRKTEHTNGISLINVNGSITKEPSTVCNIFNNFFSNIVDSQIIPNIVHKKKMQNVTNKLLVNTIFSKQLHFEPVDTIKIDSIISSFQNKFSSGIDEVPIIVLKKARKYIVTPLAHLINSSLISGIFPNQLKIAKIVPIYKKGSVTQPESYRPVSLLTSTSKIYERVVYEQLTNYLELNNILDGQQHGFRQGKSSITAMIDFIQNIIDEVDRGRNPIGIFMDLTRAFDSVNHCTLLDILQSFGIQNKELAWFQSYLSSRQQ